MKSFTYALIGAASLAAVPALAQSSNSSSGGASTTPPHNSTASSSTPMSSSDMAQLQQKITSDLQADGYKNVRVMPNSFLVHATNKQGQPVVMIINPDSVFAVTELGGNTASNNNPNRTQSGSGGALGSSGSGGQSGNGGKQQ